MSDINEPVTMLCGMTTPAMRQWNNTNGAADAMWNDGHAGTMQRYLLGQQVDQWTSAGTINTLTDRAR